MMTVDCNAIAIFALFWPLESKDNAKYCHLISAIKTER